MKVFDVGSGTPVVLVPGIQGRWEWMKPAVDALSRRCRVITFSLADEPTCAAGFDPVRGFDCYVQQIGDAMNQTGLGSAVICGVSYGGLIAAAFAARHPDRTSALVLVSAIPPSWKPDERVRFYLRSPRLLSPLFCLASLRLYKEIAAAAPGVLQGVWAAVRHGITAVTHMFSPTLMARRASMLERLDLTDELREIRAPALIITGEARLERVVPVHRTLEYLSLLPEARTVTLEQTGHLGLITKPEAFAGVIGEFVHALQHRPELQRRRDQTRTTDQRGRRIG
jgi:pimeloyl-ACP methyl ester carboxylesterase